jgi:uncharacterized protein (TIGR02271 family)
MITAFFDSRTDAEEAVTRLEGMGIARGGIRIVPGNERDTETSGTSSRQEPQGFWASLSDLFLPDEDRHVYAEGLNRGGYLVSLHVSDAEYERALDILDDEGTIDIDERAASWRSEGWTGTASGAGAGLGASTTSGTRDAGMGGIGAAAASATGLSTGTGSSTGTGLPSPSSGMSQTGLSGAGGSTHATSDQASEVIPVAEEELHVSKRDVNHGRVRVRSYVVERPVQEQVSLREENVHVERRPVTDATRTGTTSGDALFQERTIEMHETREEAVVSKEARVTEELVVRKDVDQRTETISDTVRSTEVEVEDERGNRVAGTGTTGKTTDRDR